MANRPLSLVLQHLRQLVRRKGEGGVEDGDLLGRFVRQRDEAAFEVLVWRHGPMVLSLCQRLLHNSHDAEDVLQAVFLTLVRKAATIGKQESLGSWLYKVAYRIALRARARAEKARVRAVPVEELPAAERDDEAVWRELRPLLDEAIGRLPEKYRTPIVLCYLQGKTNREAAEQMGCPIGTVSTRLTRARELLRRHLARHGVTPSVAVLGVVLGRHAVSAAVPAPLTAAVVTAASRFTAGAAGTLSANVAALIEGVSPVMLSTKIKIGMVMLVAAGVLAAGAGAMVRREAAEPPPDSPPAVAPNQSAAPKKAGRPRPAEGTVAVSGRVLAPDGKPVAGARLYWPRVPKEEPRSEDEIEVPQRGVTGADGRFRLELPRSDVPADKNLALVAAAEGYGLGWAELPKDGAPAELTLRLVEDQPIIRGRVLNTEGKPLAGIRVRVISLITTPQGGIDPFLTAWKQEWWMARGRWVVRWLPAPPDVLHPTQTDQEGQFQIRGAGAERVAVLLLKGPGIARSTVYLLTRPGFDAARYNKAVRERIPAGQLLPGQPPILHGPAFDYVAAPTRVIEGTVREAGSGKPLAGLTVFAGAGDDFLRAVSDRQGRYRLVGLPKMKEYLLRAEPGGKSPWLRQGARVQDTPGLEPLEVDFEMARGVTLTGRVIDRTTGKGVQSGLRFVPLPDNKYFGKKGYNSYRYERLMTPTDAEGRFRLAAIPGSGVLLAQVHDSEKTIAELPVKPYKLATFDAAERKRVPVEKDGNYFTAAGNSIEFLSNENACRVLDLAPDAGTVSCDLFVDRGKTLRVNVQDPDGKPLAGATVAGMTASWPITFPLTESSCTVYALDPEKPRQVLFLHSARKLAGQLTVRGDEKEPQTVRLAPTGTVTARVLDADGQAIAGAEVRLSFPSETARELYRHLNQRQEPLRTDDKGCFRLEGMVPDLTFNLQIFRGRTFLVGEPRIGPRRVGPGKTLDLGDVRTRPQQ